jgi:hypothetical protein
MAGDWMKVECDTPDKPEVLAIAHALGVDPDDAFGKCFRCWRWFDKHTESGNARGVSKALLDRQLGVSGLCGAMESVGWLIVSDNGICLPNFDRHNGQSAKRRGLTAKRVAKHTTKSNANTNAQSVSQALPEKRIEEKSKDTPPPRASVREDFRKAWNATRGAEPVDEITFDHIAMSATLIADEQFQRAYPKALAKFPLKAFSDPMTITQFLREGTVGRILAGDYDRPWSRGSPGGGGSRASKPQLPKLAEHEHE